MKKILLILILLLPSFVFAQTFERNLYYGLRNDLDVQALQEFLTEQGLYTGLITGNFFSLTLKGVKVFQTREFISPISGYFGSLSRGRANTILQSQLTEHEQEAISTTGTVTPAISTTTEFDLLKQQIELLKEQLNTLRALQSSQSSASPTQVIIVSPSPSPSPISLPLSITAKQYLSPLELGATGEWNRRNFPRFWDICLRNRVIDGLLIFEANQAINDPDIILESPVGFYAMWIQNTEVNYGGYDAVRNINIYKPVSKIGTAQEIRFWGCANQESSFPLRFILTFGDKIVENIIQFVPR